MGLLGTWSAILVPWAVAALIIRHTCFAAGPGSAGASIGYGFFLGVLPAAGLFGLQGHLGFALNPWPLIGVFAALLLVVWLVIVKSPSSSIAWRHVFAALLPEDKWGRVITIIIVAWVALRVATLAFAVANYPLFPWDAWTTWALRAKVWVELGQWVPFVSAEAWLADGAGMTRTIAAWHYPELPSWISAWASSAAGAWHERAANAPWLGALLALLAATFGQLRRWGVSIVTSWVSVWLLVSIPLMSSHVALAGYIDLWVAATLGLAFMAALSWVRDDDTSQLALAILLVAMAVLLKKEALVWASLFIPAWLAGRLPARAFWLLPVVAIGALLALMQSQGFTIHIPLLGEFTLAATGEWRWVLLHVFVFGTWHLLGYLLIISLVLLLIEMVRDRAEAWIRFGVTWVFGALLGFYVLFFWTSAAEWAVDGTSVNRILLHFTPAILFLIVAAWTSKINSAEHSRRVE